MRKMALKSLIELIPDTDLFAHMTELSFIPDSFVAEYMDTEYFYNNSGGKMISPLAEHLEDDTDISVKLANVVMNRYRVKWESLFTQYASLSTLNLLNNINLITTTDYGKQIDKEGSNTITKSGNETWTLRGTVTETVSSDSLNPYKSEMTITGKYKDTSDRSNAHKGTQEVLEEYPEQRKSEKITTGGYKDTDTTAVARTGSQKTTEKGGTTTSVFGFNSSNAVPASTVFPSDSELGTTSQLEYLGQGVTDTHSGNIHREYDTGGLKESTIETGKTKVSTSFGTDGITDTESGGIEREYNNYKESTVQTGSRMTQTDYGNAGKTNELSFNQRKDETSLDETTTTSGQDTISQNGYKYDSLVAEYVDLFMSAEFIDFLAIVYNDCDEVLTSPFYV